MISIRDSRWDSALRKSDSFETCIILRSILPLTLTAAIRNTVCVFYRIVRVCRIKEENDRGIPLSYSVFQFAVPMGV